MSQERFTIANMAYTHLFVDCLYDCLYEKDPYTLKYFDKCEIKFPNAGSTNYGQGKVGERAIEVRRYSQTANVTLNLCVV